MPRTQSSAAVSADGRHWFLLNASPDVRDQLARLSSQPSEGVRHVPIEGIVITDAELDHTLGIALLREARQLHLYASRTVQNTLDRDSRIVPVTQAFAEVTVTELQADVEQDLRYRDGGASGLTVVAFSVPGDPPRFARDHASEHTVGLLVRDRNSGGSCAFVPGCGGLDAALLARLAEPDLLLFDGTFWTDDELIGLGIGDRTARQMDHIPIAGPGGSLEQLGGLPNGQRRVYTHINNTNPILLEHSPERAQVERAGFLVGADGMSFTV